MISIPIRSYTELCKLRTFDERFDYLHLTGTVGESTFGYDRYLNQMLYSSKRWKDVRDKVIVRDDACDLGCADYEIKNRLLVHHMNPISLEDLRRFDARILDPEFLICTSHKTHLAIHYGDKSLLQTKPVNRRPGDTSPWLRSSKY